MHHHTVLDELPVIHGHVAAVITETNAIMKYKLPFAMQADVTQGTHIPLAASAPHLNLADGYVLAEFPTQYA